MNLGLFSSKPDGEIPNLVAVQDPAFANLDTVLVCPLRTDASAPGRVLVVWRDAQFCVRCDLIRPIHRQVLRPVGELSASDSMKVLRAAHSVLGQLA